MKSPISAKSIMSCNFLSISTLEKPIIVPFIYMFSIPVNSGLKPAPNSNNAEIFPLTIILPSVGVKTPVINFKRVDLPEPFLPIIPTVSPRFTLKHTLFNAKKSL